MPPRARELRVLLPQGWHAVDLVNPDARRRSLAALVTAQAGRSDELASLRAQLRAQLEGTASRAAAAGAVLMALSTMRSGDVPIPASMTIYRVPGLRLDDQGVAALRATAGPDEDWAQTSTDRGRVVRRTRVAMGEPELGAEAIPQLLVDYWLAGDGPEETVNVVFATTTVQIGTAMRDLFDQVVASIELGEPDDD